MINLTLYCHSSDINEVEKTKFILSMIDKADKKFGKLLLNYLVKKKIKYYSENSFLS